MRLVLIAAASLALAGCSRRAPEAPPASVLLVTIDTLRADRLGCYGDALAQTPVADGLARAGTLFEAAFTPSPLTLPAHATLMTGLLPPAHGARANGSHALGPGPTTLAEALSRRGRRAAAFVGGFPLSARFGLSRGFESYDDRVQKAPGLNFDFAERRADAVAAAATEWLRVHPGPVFVWAHFFDPHAPYDAPAARPGADPYREEVAFADAALGRLLAAWDARPETSLVVLASDHGEAFGEHGEWSHGLLLYDSTLRVPLIVRGGGFPAGRRVKPAVGLADVAATVIEAVGGSGPSLPGTSLRAALAPEAADRDLYAEALAPRLDFGWSELRALRRRNLKRIRAPRAELYDWRADPGETRDLGASEPRAAESLDAGLDSLLRGLGERETRQAQDPETGERLQALGYLQGPGGRGSGADPKDEVELARRIAAATGPFESAEAAARVYRELRDLDPPNPLLNLRLADALLRAGRAHESLEAYRRVIASGPRSADAHVGLATALAELERLDEAGRALEAGLAVDPRNGQLHYNLGEIARVRGERELARRRYTEALADPVTAERAQRRIEELK